MSLLTPQQVTTMASLHTERIVNDLHSRNLSRGRFLSPDEGDLVRNHVRPALIVALETLTLPGREAL